MLDEVWQAQHQLNQAIGQKFVPATKMNATIKKSMKYNPFFVQSNTSHALIRKPIYFLFLAPFSIIKRLFTHSSKPSLRN